MNYVIHSCVFYHKNLYGNTISIVHQRKTETNQKNKDNIAKVALDFSNRSDFNIFEESMNQCLLKKVENNYISQEMIQNMGVTHYFQYPNRSLF
jgi:hypothetical protein